MNEKRGKHGSQAKHNCSLSFRGRGFSLFSKTFWGVLDMGVRNTPQN